MFQIKISGAKKATIDFNGYLYPGQVLRCAAEQFRGTCRAKIKNAPGGRLVVELSPSKGFSPREAALVFCNNALALRQSGGL
ncbi:MAG: hypothetical protein NTW59_04970 [Candidatus Diapherotrites archaeon]|nr:hypothetical protein [Candidatus Diapherotrites archaeon]